MKKMLFRIIKPIRLPHFLQDLILMVPRLLCGLLLTVAFGADKFGLPWSPDHLELGYFQVIDWFAEDIAAYGGIFAVFPYFFAWMGAFSEAVGGIFLALGLKTRLFSFLLVCTMLVAIIFQKADAELWNMLPAMGFLWIGVFYMIIGSGRFGLDYLIARKMKSKMIFSTVKKNQKPAFIILLLALSTGLQAQEISVEFSVDMREEEQVSKLKLKGNIAPLNWEEGMTLDDKDGDGIYSLKLTFPEATRIVQFKYMNDSTYELDGKSNRIIDLKYETKVVRKFNNYSPYTTAERARFVYSDVQIEEDIQVLKKVLEAAHPQLFAYMTKEEWTKNIQLAKSEMKASPNLPTAYLVVSKLVQKIKCSHTFVNPYNQVSTVRRSFYYGQDLIPVSFQRVDSRLLVDKYIAEEGSSLARGFEVIEINGVLVSEIMKNLSQYVTSDGDNYQKSLERLTMKGDSKFELFDIYYSLVYGSFEQHNLKLRNLETGAEISCELKGISKTDRDLRFTEKYPSFSTDFESAFSFDFIDEKTALLTISSFASWNSSFDWKEYLDDKFLQLKEKETENLIIDIRKNEGGENAIPEYIMQYLLKNDIKVGAADVSLSYKKFPTELKKYVNTWDKSAYNWKWKVKKTADREYKLRSILAGRAKTYKAKRNAFQGQTFLLVGAENSSATHIMATYCKKYSLATLVGQETGGNQRGMNGGVLFFSTLPHSRIEIDIPILGIKLDQVDSNTRNGGILPDVMVTKKALDLAKDVDTELQVALSLIK